MRRLRRPSVLATTRVAVVVALGLALTAGCAARPTPYTVEPAEFEANRAAFGRVGIALVTSPGEVEIVAPAKGWWGGLKRGAFSGAATPIVIGFLSPVPMGTAIGALFAPWGAAIGGVYGIVVAPSTELVEQAEVGIDLAVERLLATDVREELRADLVESIRSRSRFEAVELAFLTLDEDGELDLAPVPAGAVDTLIVLGPSAAGLAGPRALNPPLTGTLATRVRVIAVGDEREPLYDYEVTCLDAERSYQEWGADQGAAFDGAMRNCLPLLLEKVLDDLFLLHRGLEDGT